MNRPFRRVVAVNAGGLAVLDCGHSYDMGWYGEKCRVHDGAGLHVACGNLCDNTLAILQRGDGLTAPAAQTEGGGS